MWMYVLLAMLAASRPYCAPSIGFNVGPAKQDTMVREGEGEGGRLLLLPAIIACLLSRCAQVPLCPVTACL